LLVITKAAIRVPVLRSVPGRRMLAILVGLVQVVMAAGRGPVLRLVPRSCVLGRVPVLRWESRGGLLAIMVGVVPG
jgi:hypothetical protein